MDSEKAKEQLGDSTKAETNVRESAPVAPLRIWPAVLLLISVWCLRFCGACFEEPSMEVMMAQFMGPGAVSLLVLVWWVFFSRALLWEKLVGAIGLIAIAVVSTMLADRTVQGMGTMIYGIPWGATAFCLGAFAVVGTGVGILPSWDRRPKPLLPCPRPPSC